MQAHDPKCCSWACAGKAAHGNLGLARNEHFWGCWGDSCPLRNRVWIRSAVAVPNVAA